MQNFFFESALYVLTKPNRMTERPTAPNWLTCASCHAPIVTPPELLAEEVPVLRGAVYAYRLDMLEKEVTVYSATNTADNRFDVVRIELDESVLVPNVPQQNLQDEREGLQLFLRHFQLAHAAGNEALQLTPTTTRELLEDLDRYEEENPEDTSSPEDAEQPDDLSPSSEVVSPSPIAASSPKRRVSEVIARRIHTSYTEPTDEYSWFPTFSWTIASCRVCREHLGWVFWQQVEGKWERFFCSLIVTRLREKLLPAS